jgi:6-phosphogluconolactonase
MVSPAAPPPTVHVLKDSFEVENEVAQRFAMLAQAAINAKGRFNVALAGGSTPKGAYARLAREFRDRVDWSRVHFYWGDERCVAADDPQSNFSMARRELLDPLEIATEQIHGMDGAAAPESAARRYAEQLRELPLSASEYPIFDLVLLGLGKDGHTASLFPGDVNALENKERRSVVPGFSPEGTRERLTLTFGTINASSHVVFMAVGSDKALPLRSALTGKSPETPASLVQPGSRPAEWYVDRAAYSEMAG